MNSATATLLISCTARPGLVAKFANFIYANGGNIIHADQHTDRGRRSTPSPRDAGSVPHPVAESVRGTNDFNTGLFLNRLEWQLTDFNLPREAIATAFGAIAIASKC